MSKTVTNIAGAWDKSNISGISNAQTINFLIETSSTDRTVTKYLRSIPGTDGVLGDGEYRNLHYVNNTLYAVKGGEFGIVDLTNLHFIKIVNVSEYHEISICNSGIPTPYVFVTDGSYLYATDTTKTYGEQVTGCKTIECPPNSAPGSIVYSYGYLLMLDENTGRIYHSMQWPFDKEYTYRGWTANDIFGLHIETDTGEPLNEDGRYFLAEWVPDITKKLLIAKNSVIAVGTKSQQCFTYSGSPFLESPFQTNDSTAVPYGGIISEVMSNIVYSYSPDKGIYAYDGTTITKVSNLDLDRELNKHEPIDAFKCNLDGHDLVVFRFEGLTMAYDGDWIQLSTLVNGSSKEWRYHCAVRIDNDTYLGHEEGLAKVNLSKWTEHDGNPIRRMRRGQIWERSGNKIQLDCLRILYNSGQTDRLILDGVMHVTFCRDGSSQSTIKECKLPVTGKYGKDIRLYRLGIGTRWDVQLECSDNAPLAIFGVETDFYDTIGSGV